MQYTVEEKLSTKYSQPYLLASVKVLATLCNKYCAAHKTINLKEIILKTALRRNQAEQVVQRKVLLI